MTKYRQEGWVGRSSVALLLSCELFEDFFDPIGIDFERFRTSLNGGWLFGYIEALKKFHVRTAIFLVSARVSTPIRLKHVTADVPIWILPAPRTYRNIRAYLARQPSAGQASLLLRRLHRRWLALLRHSMPYLATPPVLLARALCEERCGVIVCQEYENARFDVCVALSKMAGLRVVGAFHGGDAQRTRFERYIRPFAIRASDGLIIPLEAEEARVRSQYGARSVEIRRIFNPLDSAAWTPIDRGVARRALGMPANGKLIVWHGRGDARTKGLEHPLNGGERIQLEMSDRDVRLVMVGSGSDRQELSRRLDGRRAVVWIDEFVSDADSLRRYLSAADVYAFPSRREGAPVALMEAMSCALPVVATDIPSVREILGPGQAATGVLVPVEDPAAFADALIGLLEDERGARELGQRARERIVRGFSLDAIGSQLDAFLNARGLDRQAKRRAAA
jgi:glycosyltransferase involved in cell wall biosynthesis